MSEPTKEALELANALRMLECKLNAIVIVKGDAEVAAVARECVGVANRLQRFDAHTASLREELRAAREALEPLAVLGVAKQETECSLQSMNTPFWDCPPDLVLFDDRMGNVITVLDVRRARAACKGGDAV